VPIDAVEKGRAKRKDDRVGAEIKTNHPIQLGGDRLSIGCRTLYARHPRVAKVNTSVNGS